MKALPLLLLAAASPAAAVEWMPIASAQALGGVHRFGGAPGTVSGNADALFAPAARLDEEWTLVPSLKGSYQGTRRVADVLGTATPAQESADLRLAARAVWTSPGGRWKLKPGLSYRLGWLKETRDEAWGEGLFDERLATVGAELEAATREPHSIRASLDYFQAVYPNYSSLESRAALEFAGRPLARELVGDRVLDRAGVRAAASADAPAGERLRVEGGFATTWSRFQHQRDVDDAGQLGGGAREDFLTNASVALKMPRDLNADLRLLGSLVFACGVLESSQNGYDASRGRFLPGAYDYREVSIAPTARALIGRAARPATADLGIGWRRRWYPGRPAQDAVGADAFTGATRITEWTLSAAGTYPLTGGFSLVLALERASASSNQKFERFFRYSYEATTVLAGARWDW